MNSSTNTNKSPFGEFPSSEVNNAQNLNPSSKYYDDEYPSCAQPRPNRDSIPMLAEESLLGTSILDSSAEDQMLDSVPSTPTPFRKAPNKAIVTSNILISGPTVPLNTVTKVPTVNSSHAFEPATKDSTHDNSCRLKDKRRHLKPSPIFIANNESLDFNSLNASLKDLLGDTYLTKSNKYGINITCHNNESHAKLRKFLLDNQNKFVSHTYQTKSERGFRGVIRHLNKTTSYTWIREKLSNLGFQVRFLNVIKSRSSKEPLHLFEIELEKCDKASTEAFLKLKMLGNQQIAVEKLLRKDVPQCHRCQCFGHTKNYCLRPFVCVKCAGGHPSTECSKLKISKPKCANCYEEHTANYKGCIAYKEAFNYLHQPSHITNIKEIISNPRGPRDRDKILLRNINKNTTRQNNLLTDDSLTPNIRKSLSNFNNLSYAEVLAGKNKHNHNSPQKEKQIKFHQQHQQGHAPILLRHALNNSSKHRTPLNTIPPPLENGRVPPQEDFNSTLTSKLDKLMSILADTYSYQHQTFLEYTAAVKTCITQVSYLVTTMVNTLMTSSHFNFYINKNNYDQTSDK